MTVASSTSANQERIASDQATATVDVCAIGQNMHIGISSFGAWMLGVGGIIGSMAWLFHTYMIARAGTLASVTAWLVAMLAFFPVVLILAELSSMFPAAGGPYLYKYYAFKRLIPSGGELLGFLTGWLFWICLLSGFACMSNGLANLLATSLFGTVNASPVWFGPVAILGLFAFATLINQMQVNHSVLLNNVFTIMKFAMALSFGILVLACPSSSLSNLLHTSNLSGDSNFLVNVCSVLTLAIGGFGGIELIACASSETKNASKSVPKAMFLTLISIALIYSGMCAAVSIASPFSLSSDKSMSVVTGTTISATVPGITSYLIGNSWGRIATAAVVASIVGCAIGGLLACARIGYSMAKTGLFPQQFGKLNATTKVPTYALWFQCVCCCVMGVGACILSRAGIFADAYSFLGETYSYMYILLVVLYGVSFISLRYTDPHLARPFRIGAQGNWLAWIMTVLTIGIFGFIALVCTKGIYQISGLLILLAGIPVYGYYRWRRPKLSSS